MYKSVTGLIGYWIGSIYRNVTVTLFCIQLSTYAGVLCNDGDQLLFGLRVFSVDDTSVP